jgi:hypothetical protein
MLKDRRLNLCMAILLAWSGFAQAQPTPSVDEVVKQLIAYSKDYRAKLPSLECDESIVSQQIKGDKVKWEVKAEATLRQIRDSKDPDEFNDSYTFKSVDGHPPKARFKLPYFVNGAFANGIGFASDDSHGSDDSHECFSYALSREDGGTTLRLEVTAKPVRTASDCKDVFAEYHKIVLVDAATGIVKHITRSMSPAAARKHREVVFASIDYAPQNLGELTLWLPVRVESHNGKGERRMTATFSNYHRYTGEARILPGVVELPATDAPIP